MNIFGHILLIFFLSLLSFVQIAFSQNNLGAAYSSLNTVPDFLNICGNEDEIAVTISLDGQSVENRTNISAQLHFFKGVELVNFDMVQSSAGIILTNNTDPSNPIFSIPDLSPFGTTSVEIWCTIKANCEYVDTLLQNDQIQVFDTWEFNYDLGNATGLTEFDATSEYRDAFVVPLFTMDIENNNPPAKIEDCFTRDIKISNSALDGFVDTLFYSNEQGAGVYIHTISANGLSIPFSKTLNPNGDTLISVLVDGPFFQQNLFGNGDDFFDPNESLTITESYCLVSCDLSMASLHTIGWGCNDEICAENSLSDFVIIGEGSANVDIKTFGTLPNEFAGYCEVGQTTVTFTNNGVEFDPGFATMYDLELGITLGNNFELSNNNFTITGIRIAGIDIANFDSLNNLHGQAQFMSDPDGLGGLEDIDGDGFFDDLALGDFVEITAFYEFSCSGANTIDDDNCLNNFSTSFHTRLDYSDSCNERLSSFQNNFFRPANTSASVTNSTDPDAYVELDTFFLSHLQTRSIRFFDHDCNDEQVIEVKIALPQGVFPITGMLDLLKNGLTAIPLISEQIQNDTLILVYDASFSPFLNGDYDLQLAFEADCSAALGASNFPMQFTFICPPCDCEHIWYCGDLPGPQLHAQSPPCPPDVLTCDIGIQTTSFEVNRTTFGFQDNLFQIPFNPEEANKKVGIACDSVEMKLVNVVGQVPISDSLGVTISYTNPDETNSLDEVFEFGSGTVRFTNNGNEFFCPVPNNLLTTQIDTSSKKLVFDLNSCLTSLGLTLIEGDTVEFIGNFGINPEGPYSVQFTKIPNFRALGFANIDGQEHACDNFGETFTIAKNRIAFDFPNNNNFPIGCEETVLQYRLIIVNNGFEDYFGDELRPASKVDSLVFDFDPNILEAFDLAEVDVSIPGHPVFGNDFFPISPLNDFPNGHYQASFDTLLSVPTLNEVQSYTFNLRLTLIPNCSSIIGSSNGDNVYDFDATIFYEDRYYASFIGDGTCVLEEIQNVNSNIAYSDPPTFALNPVTNSDFTLEGDTAIWVIQHCNNSFTSDAGITWIGISDTTGTLEIVSIENITDPSNPILLPHEDYSTDGSQVFAFTGELLKADGINAFEEICNFIRIKATINQCVNTNFEVFTGWNCELYSESDWTPELYPPCDSSNLDLSITILDPFLDANVTDQPLVNPDICDTSSITILLRNADRGTAFDVQTQLILPLQGATLIPGSVEIAYPSNANFQAALSDPLFIGNTTQGQIFQYDDFSQFSDYLNVNGLEGFNPSNPTDSNEVKIRFQFETDCDFRSGDLAFYNFQGFKGCGAPTNFESGESFPLEINGAEPDLSKVFLVGFSGQSFLVSNSNSSLQISFTNLTNTPSTLDDRISLSLPPNVTYVLGSSFAINPGAWLLDEPSIETVGGFQRLTWRMIPGLLNNESATFSFEVSSPTFDCDQEGFDVELITTTVNELFCEAANVNCEVETISSLGGNVLTELPIGGAVIIDFQSVTSTCFNATEEEISFSGNLVSSEDLVFDNFTLSFYYDENGNGIIDSLETKIDEISLSGSIGVNTPLPFQNTLSIQSDQVCSILVQLLADNTELCGSVIAQLPIPQIQNAGTDQVLCLAQDSLVSLFLGDAACSQLTNYDLTWTAIPPAQTTDLSNFKLANPELTFTFDGTDADTLTYILETQRPNCALSSFDTINVVGSPEIVVADNDLIVLAIGQDTTLNPLLTGGTAPFVYNWSPGTNLDFITSPNPIASPINDITYFVTITDSNGCEGIGSFDIQVISPVEAGVNPSDTTLCLSESVQLEAFGGDQYLWLEDSNNPTSGNLSSTIIANPIFSNGAANGIYNYQVVVSQLAFPDFPDTAEVTIVVFDTPVANAGSDVNLCLGEQVSLSGFGIGGNTSIDYTYQWSPQVLFGQGTPNPIVAPGQTTEYVLTISDVNGCSSSDSLTVIVEDCSCPDIIVTNVNVSPTLCGEETGTATIGIDGDESNYSFIWSPDIGLSQGAGNERINLPFGGYSVTVQNVNDPACETIVPILISNEDGPIANASVTNANCQTNTGTANLSPDTYDYIWEDGSMESSRNDLIPGTYFVTFSEPGLPNCQNVVEITIQGINPLEANMEVLDLPDCGEANGSVQLNVTGGSGNYIYSWPSNTNIQNDLAGGIYTVTISDQDLDGCETDLVFVLQDSVLEASIDITDTIEMTCYGANNGGIEFNITYAQDFVFPADTVISNGFQTFENGNLPSGDYCIMIFDGNFCVAGASCFTIPEIEPYIADVQTFPDCGDGGSIEVEISGGNPPFIFDWEDLINPVDPQNRDNLQAGIYNLKVSDQMGCDLNIAVEIYPCDCEPPTIESIGITEAKCGISNGSAVISIDDNPFDYSFNWTPDLGTVIGAGNARQQLPAAGYSVEIQNNTNSDCTSTAFVLITNEDGPEANVVSKSPATCEANDGGVILSPDNFNYSWSDGGTGFSRSDLAAGIYFATFSDPSNPDCENVLQVEIDQENPLLAEIIINQEPDCGQSNGSVTINVLGGVGPFDYSWPSGTDTQTGLSSGFYSVTVTDLSSTMCALPVIFVLEDLVPKANVSVLDTIDVDCFGGDNGGIQFEVDFEGNINFPADTLITNGLGEFENGNLVAGSYCLMITDVEGCVLGSTCFEIAEPEPIHVDFVSTQGCDDKGSINLTLSGGTAPFQFFWENVTDNPNNEDQFNLPEGYYNLVVQDANGCQLTMDSIEVAACITCDVYPTDSVFIQTVHCDSIAELCLEIHNNDFPKYTIKDNGQLYTGPFIHCDFDFFAAYAYSPLPGQGQFGPYEVLSWQVGNNTFSGEFQDVQALLDSMNTWDPLGNWMFDPSGAPFIIGGIQGVNYSTIEVLVINGGLIIPLGFNAQSVPKAFAVELSVGLHEIIVTDTITGCQDTIFATVHCTETSTRDLVIEVGDIDTLCFNGDELLGPIDTIFNACEDGSFVGYEIFNDSCFIITGLIEGFETACVVLCDSLGFCDTTFVNITVLDNGNITDTILLTQVVEVCFDSSDLNFLQGPIVSIENLCPSLGDESVSFEFNDTTFCVLYEGISIGTDTACFQFCDALGNCDDINFYITVVPGEVVTDTIPVLAPAIDYCLNTSLLSGDIVSMVDICSELNGEQILFELDTITNCISYLGLSEGVDTACIRLEDEFGDVWLTYFVISAFETHPETICDTLFINQSETICLDLSELPGTLDNSGFFCDDLGTGNANFSIDPFNPNCVFYTGQALGRDTACIEICDDYGICDTTFFCIDVVEYFDPPILVDDIDSTVKNTPVVIDIKANDTIFGNIQDIFILDPPDYGTAQIFLDCSAGYTPFEEFCERSDFFTYVVCNENGCDTATVEIYIRCVELTVFNAISPNDDGVNDIFYIAKIKDFPNNRLWIYNRWGNLVYDKVKYDNEERVWPGTWTNEKDLPDGTYYYILEWFDDGQRNVQRGYIELFR